MDILLAIFQLALLFAGWFLYTYVKKLPDQVHAKNLKAFELDLNKQLEEFRNQLTTDLELMKINESQLHIHKTQEFSKLVEVLLISLTDKDYVRKLGSDKRIQKEHNKKMLDLGTKLFFFASDETVKKFVEWRKYSLTVDTPQYEAKQVIIILAELIVLIRKDLGYSQTECTKDDFLHIMLTDWDRYKTLEG
ncbi:hypothetical protein JDW21_11565 [Bacillus subtilis]|uniref:Uncharacterized protein n=1 Tax=Bacillus spizizenii TaxID=96241 RepID=A0A9Q4E3P2_BACSC|nr:MULTISPECIES: hypothetical protein [Bacillus]MCY8451952.1 hypothetical protein [Bacillus spizizenii]KXZ12832.1 hypothetical protein AXI57_16625 [Bacillus atrophaeus]MCY8456071.1 hypothetical protein [Bacillus spizizenii]MCY8921521.1 hypothetical protein [Bacillus atrophaeus]MDS9998524.1 hypothetical protein [Bacillus atrophaeus]